jgi:hypothetical protein
MYRKNILCNSVSQPFCFAFQTFKHVSLAWETAASIYIFVHVINASRPRCILGTDVHRANKFVIYCTKTHEHVFKM